MYASVACSAKVSRSWLYKYIGKSKNDLLEFAVDYFGKIFAELQYLATTLLKKTGFVNRLMAFSYYRLSGEKVDEEQVFRDFELAIRAWIK